jgi:hypothetical protein
VSYHAIIIVLALALLLSGVVEQADNDLNEALGILTATISINKGNGEFGLALFSATAKVLSGLGEDITHGRCVKG